MKTIFLIFWGDVKRISSNVVAIVIIMGLSIIPALYAWFNILSNWDPYGPDATAGMKVAIYSEDTGYSLSGISLNVGDSVIEALRGNDTIGWQFAESREEALQGVRSGAYYAALVLPKDFTAHLMSFTQDEPTPATIEYFENSKKNAIATKITSKVEKTVQTQIATSFVEKIAETSWAVGQVLGAKAQDTDVFDVGRGALQEMESDLALLDVTLESLENTGQAASHISASGRDLLSSEKSLIDSRIQIVEGVKGDVDNSKNRMIKTVEDQVKKDQEMISKIKDKVDSSLDETLPDGVLPEGGATGEEPKDKLKVTLDSLTKTALIEELEKQKKVAAEDMERQANYTKDVLEKSKLAMMTLQGNFSSIEGAMKAYEQVLKKGGTQLQATRAYVGEIQESLTQMSQELTAVQHNSLLEDMQDLIDQDPKQMATFLSSPVALQTEGIFPIASYGSAMAPFYTVLAIWVGGLILVALLHAKVKPEPNVPDPKPWQQFFGRYLTFFLIGQAQALIILLGDLFFVEIQCLHPVRFVLAGLVTSFVFTFFMYSLSFALGNVGEAVAVVVMVIQVAGSGGTFPIEVLPEIYQKIVGFLLFPDAMNALRECIGGMYGDAYLYAIVKLLSYVLLSLFIGLVLSIPFRGLNRRIEGSKKRSGLMV